MSRGPLRATELELPGRAGPAEGTYLVRRGSGAHLAVLVRGVGAPRAIRRPRRARGTAEPAPVPLTRFRVIDPDPDPDPERWLDGLRKDRARAENAVIEALGVVDALLSAHLVAAADPATSVADPTRLSAARAGYGEPDLISAGLWEERLELPLPRRPPGDDLAAQQLIAEVLRAESPPGPAGLLLARALGDLERGRVREAALGARVGLEALLRERPGDPELAEIEQLRRQIGEAANSALDGTPSADALDAVRRALRAGVRALRRPPAG